MSASKAHSDQPNARRQKWYKKEYNAGETEGCWGEREQTPALASARMPHF